MSDRIDNICKVLKSHLGRSLAAVILCGSYDEAIGSGSDIDILIIVNELEHATAQQLAAARAELKSILGLPCSTTVITREDVEDLNNRFGMLDGKAVQTLIECKQKAVRFSAEPFVIPKLQANRVKTFSHGNYWIVRALLIKMLIRANQPLKLSQRKKIAKLSLILVKMANQYSGVDDSVLNDDLIRLKDENKIFSDQETYTLALKSASLLAKKSI